MILNNPEFTRNRWLELKPRKMIAAAAILAAIFSITYLAADTLADFFTSLRITAYIALVVSVFLLGLKDASESIISEVNNKTWDSQRMTSVTPWEMALGKLLGSTAFSWYCGTFCITVIFAAALVLPDTVDNIKILIVVILGAFTGQAAALGFSLLGIKKCRYNAELKSSSYFVLVLLTAAFFTFSLQAVVSIESPNLGVFWYGKTFLRLNFLLFSVSLFLFFSVLGLYRNMRIELQYENGPWVWVFFLVSLVVYSSGFVSEEIAGSNDLLLTRCYLAYLIMLALTYFMALGESKYIIDLKLLFFKIQSRSWNDVQKLAPLWLITLLVAVAGCGVILIVNQVTGQYASDHSYNALPAYFPLTLLCFVLRDLALLLYFNLTVDSARADMVTVLVLLVLYLLVPLFISFTKHAVLMSFFVPLPDGTALTGTLPAAVQFGIMFFLLKKRWAAIGRVAALGGF